MLNTPTLSTSLLKERKKELRKKLGGNSLPNSHLKMHMLLKKLTVVLGSTLFLTITVIAVWFTQSTERILPPHTLALQELYHELYIINWSRTDDISCHYITKGDALPAIEEMDPPPSPDSIFFHETSCRGGFNSRQACVVESVARIHPERSIYIFFNSPVSERVLKRSCLSKLMQFKNIHIARLHTAEYAKGTVLEQLLSDRKNINRSKWRTEHVADMLRFITLYRYGGMYLDTDMLLVKRLDPLGKNWAGRESDIRVSIAALAFTKDGVGHDLLTEILHEIQVGYQPYSWTWNGPGALTRSLLKFCNCSSIPDLSARTCNGFEVYKPDIYPLDYTYAIDYYVPRGLPERTNGTFTHHLWNRLTHHLKVAPGSPFEVFARKYCPTIRNAFGNNFGA